MAEIVEQLQEREAAQVDFNMIFFCFYFRKCKSMYESMCLISRLNQ